MRTLALMAIFRTGAVAAVVLTLSVLMTKTGAVAETEHFVDAAGDQTSGSLDIRSVNIDNGDDAITATIAVDGLEEGTGDRLYLHLDIGPGDNDVDYYSYLVSTTQQGDAPATMSIQTELSKTRPTELMNKARCQASSAAWDVPAAEVRLRIPHYRAVRAPDSRPYPETAYTVSGTVWDLRGAQVHRIRTIERTLTDSKIFLGGWSRATCFDGTAPGSR